MSRNVAGGAFQSFGAAALKEQSRNVLNILPLQD
jgi:hypothetical protein